MTSGPRKPPKRARKPVQLALDLRHERRGGPRKGAGRKPAADRVGFVKHVARPRHVERHPVHVVARCVRGVPHLRHQRVMAAVRAMLARASEKGLRLLHFSVQGNHLHLIVEATDNLALARGIQRLLSRIALAINGIAQRSGRVWRDRYFRKDLTNPSQLRNALVYVLFNVRKHDDARSEDRGLDDCSSAAWLVGWAPNARPDPAFVARAGPRIVAEPRSWLFNRGWHLRGALRRNEEIKSI